MTTKPDKKPVKRQVAMPRLHKAIGQFCADHNIGDDQPVSVLLDAVRDAWFEEAQK